MQANISDIKKVNVRGSSGIRTVVRFIGCPLRCPWCSSPESQSPPTRLLWDRKKCFYGHLCELRCPTKSLKFENDVLQFNRETCTGCFSCITQCPTKALAFAGRMVEPDEVMEEILSERDAYLEPDSSVVLAGGEVLWQPDFAAEILKRCHDQSIHTVLQTNGFATSIVFSKVTRQADLLLFDIKHYNERDHVKYTGVSQGKILANLDNAVSSHIPVIARIPVVSGVNNTLKDAGQFVKLLKEHKITSAALVSYSQPGNSEGFFPVSPESLAEYASVFTDAGIKIVS